MRTGHLLVGCICFYLFVTGSILGAVQSGPVTLVPPPKQATFGADPITFRPASAVLVVGRRASEPERYAAELFRKHVARRFGVSWPIRTEGEDLGGAEVVFLLGQRTTHDRLDRLCEAHRINLNDRSPGHDGYVIEMVEDDEASVILVGGSNPRGVIYGQDTLFQLIRRDGQRLGVVRAAVRDWPSIPWRGRPRTDYHDYLRPGELDCYMTARVNWIDLRTDTYAFDPEEELDEASIAEVIRQAHRRGLIVYATVNCGMPRSKYGAILKMFDAMVRLGADGLWMSFDDKGPGEAPEELVERVLAYGRDKGITGHLISICPPKGSYQKIDTKFNRKIMAVDGMERAMWAWTVVPSAESLAAARSIGARAKPMWWHNWIRPASGFTHISHRTLYTDGRRSYLEVPTLKPGWHAPGYDILSDAARYCDSVLPWGAMKLTQYYHIPVLTWWAWDPAAHDYAALRDRIYRIVFGAGQVADAARFDTLFVQLKSLFVYPERSSKWFPACPARLKRPADRERALELVGRLEQLVQRIEKKAAAESLLPAEEVTRDFLEPMHGELVVARAAATLPYPEYWWDGHQRKILEAVYDGDLTRADALAAEVRGRLRADVDRIERQLGYLKGVREYVAWWRKCAERRAGDWQKLVAERRAELARRLDDYAYFVVKLSTMLAGLDDPPLGWGTGRWERANRVLATVLPTAREQYWGDWIAGLYEAGGRRAAVFAAKRRDLTTPGTYAELEVRLPVSGARDRLALMFFVSNTNKDEIGLDFVRARWAGARVLRLLWGEKVLWEYDVGWSREDGQWSVVRLPTIPEDVDELVLRLRVEELKSVTGHGLVFVGPIRLIQLPD